jgi:hypothetical protein
LYIESEKFRLKSSGAEKRPNRAQIPEEMSGHFKKDDLKLKEMR